MTSHELIAVLSRVRRRMVGLNGTAGLFWGVTAAVACLVAGAWCDLVLDLPPLLRLLAVGTSVLSAVLIFSLVLRAAFRRGTPSRLADRLDEVAQSGGQIRSGVDLDLHPAEAAKYSADPGLTAGLAAMAVDRAAALAAGVKPARAVPAAVIRKSLVTMAATAALVALIVLLLPKLAFTQWLRFTDPFGDHPAWSPYTFHLTPAGGKAVYGSNFEIRAKVDGPAIDQLELILTKPGQKSATPDVLPMFPEPGGAWRASLASVSEPLDYHVRVGRARSPRYRMEVVTVPKIEEVSFRIESPAYTREPVYAGPLPARGLEGLRGTKVRVTARSNRPLSGGRVELPGGKTLSLKPPSPGASVVAGEFALERDGKFELKVTDADGQPSTDTFSGGILLKTDESPFVRLVAPQEVSLATPTALVPVVISAEDDFGLSHCQLFRSLNDSRYLPMEVPLPKPAPRRTYQSTVLPLAAYGVEPGDEIKLFARVQDNDPAPGAVPGTTGKGSESPVVVIRIISHEAFDEMQRSQKAMDLLASKYQQARRRMESLAQEIAKEQEELAKQPDKPTSDETRHRLQKLAERMEKEAEMLRKAAEEKLPYELDKKLSPELEKMADQVERLAKRLKSEAEKPLSKKEMEKLMKEMAEQLDQGRQQLDSETKLPLELLEQLMALKTDESRFLELYLRQNDLAERLASLKGRDQEDDPALKGRMRELQEEQQQIREELDRLLKDIEEHAGQLADDERLKPLRETALKFVKACRSCGAAEAMTEAETGLSEFSGTRGEKGAREAKEALEKLLKQCKGMGGACKNCLPKFGPGFPQSVGQTIDQMLKDMKMPGFGEGDGIGNGLAGQAGGRSSRRGQKPNVGLYGDQPQMDQGQSQQGNRSSDRQASARRSRNGESQPGDEEASRPDGSRQASGSADAVIPPGYRSKVSRYFQRLADEVGDQ